ncbi:Maf family nucleotide pyrophosphatase [Wenyingzhuangia sp. IMCC45574]
MLQKLLSSHKIILGSKSPRRQQFLKDLNIPFDVKTSEAEEIYPHHLTRGDVTEFLAKQKAFNIGVENNELLITSDTIVWFDGQALGKPTDKDDAIRILENLSGSSHEVITSVCLSTIKKTHCFTVATKVFVDELDKDEINFYVNHYEPFDKAGSYGIQEWIGLIAVSKIEGSYTNVVGLPTSKLYQELKNFL